jgi:hypothetical protein
MPSNLIKTPKEILLTKAGIPHLKKGKKVKKQKRSYSVEDMKAYIRASKLKDNPVKRNSNAHES